MGRKRTPGLVKRQGIWHIDKQIRGSRLCESTCTSDLEEAEAFLARRIDEIRQAAVDGVRPNRTFREAATKYLLEGTKRSLDRDAQDMKIVDEFIGTLPLHQVHMGTLQGFIAARAKDDVKSASVNRTLAVVRRVLNLAARLWRDENGLTWLETPTLIQFVDWDDTREPYPLS